MDRPLLRIAPLLAAASLAAPAFALARAPRGARTIAWAGSPATTKETIESLRRDGRAHAAARRFTEAIRDYERLLVLLPGDAEVLARLAQLQAFCGNYDQAIVLYREAIARRPRDPGIVSDLADVLTWANRLEEAERLYEQVLARDAGHHEALKGLARARLLRGDVASAAPVIDRALRLYPSDVDLHCDRARMLSQGGQLDEAVRELRRAAQLAPSDPDVLRRLAETYQQKRDWPDALESWLRVAQLAPDAPESHAALGRIYLTLGKLSLAREHAALAVRISPTAAAARDLMAEVERQSVAGPLRTAGEWVALGAGAALLPLMLVIARRSRRSARRKREKPEGRQPEQEVVLALGAHPDDVELGCGGFLLKLKANGARVYALTFTRGEKGTDRAGEREVEAKRAAAFLGLDGQWVLEFPDTGLQEKIPQIKGAIEAKIRELGATLVLTHTDVDVHGDHRAVFAATREAARSVRTVLCYEDVSTPDSFTPNFYVDVTHYIDDHLKACALHRTQEHRTYMDPRVIQGRAAHRGLQAGVRFAMAFRTLNMVR